MKNRTREKVAMICYGAAIAGLLLTIGSAGAVDLGNIGVGQFILQSIIGVALLGAGAFLGYKIGGDF